MVPSLFRAPFLVPATLFFRVVVVGVDSFYTRFWVVVEFKVRKGESFLDTQDDEVRGKIERMCL